MFKNLKRTAAASGAVLGLAGISLFAAAPAQAYQDRCEDQQLRGCAPEREIEDGWEQAALATVGGCAVTTLPGLAGGPKAYGGAFAACNGGALITQLGTQ